MFRITRTRSSTAYYSIMIMYRFVYPPTYDWSRTDIAKVNITPQYYYQYTTTPWVNIIRETSSTKTVTQCNIIYASTRPSRELLQINIIGEFQLVPKSKSWPSNTRPDATISLLSAKLITSYRLRSRKIKLKTPSVPIPFGSVVPGHKRRNRFVPWKKFGRAVVVHHNNIIYR